MGEIMPESPLLQMEEVSMRYGDSILFSDFSLELHRDEIVGLTGSSGSGKSTILRFAVDLATPSSGCVKCDGKDISKCDPREIRRKLVLVTQEVAMFQGTVRDNLLWGLEIRGLTATDDELIAVLSEVNLEAEFLDRIAENLSGGEKQRVAIARALLLEPDALLLDEPTSALDETSTLAVENAINDIREDRNIGVLIVTHNREQAERFTSRIIEIENRNGE
jgi:putative ABC transport system ATP-binding protein